MPRITVGIKAGGIQHPVPAKKRRQWDRPVLQRLAAKEARAGFTCGNDGGGKGGCADDDDQHTPSPS